MKKTIIYTALVCVAIWAIFWGLLLLDMNPLGYCILFIVPLAGVLIGFSLGWALKTGMKKDNIMYSKKIAGVTVAVVCGLLIFLTLFEYFSTYIVETPTAYEFNHIFKGDHVSDYTYYGEPINLFVFFKMNYLEPTYTLGGNSGDAIDTGISGIGGIIYLLQYIVACLITVFEVKGLKDVPVCGVCGIYYVNKNIDRFSTTDEQSVINGIISNTNASVPYTPVSPKLKKYNLALQTCFCPSCHKAVLIFTRPEKNGNQVTNKVICTQDITAGQLSLFVRDQAK